MKLNYYQGIKKYLTSERTPFFLIAKKYIDETSKILDVGGGDGSFARTIDRSDTYMLDGNQESVDFLKGKFSNVKYGLLPTLPYESQFFDLIHCSHVVEHLSPQQLYDSLLEIDRCLKPGGHLIISAPLLSNFFYDDLSHLRPYSPFVFIKYLSLGNQHCATRPLVSKNYTIKEQVYRYNYKSDSYINFYEKMSVWYRPAILMHKLSLKFWKWFGVRKVERTGFTIVLQKQV